MSLFDMPQGRDRPIDPICGKPVAWQPRSHRWGRYCGGNNCLSPTRVCKNCRKTFLRKDGGTRYCSPECLDQWYKRKPATALFSCPVCGVEHGGKNKWRLCSEHWSVIEPVRHQLANAHVSVLLVVQFVKWPFCPVDGCGRGLLEYDEKARCRVLAVDHDPTLGCHPGPPGCELCVRGLVCRADNLAMHRDVTPRQHRGRAAYLEAWERRGDG